MLNAKTEVLDRRVQFYLEETLALPLEDLPDGSVCVLEMPDRGARMLKFGSVQKNRLLIRRIGSRGVALAAPEIIDVVRATIDCLHTWELFSTLGVAELDRALHRVGHEALGGAIHYTLSETDYASGGPVTDA